jgi:adenylate cyclase
VTPEELVAALEQRILGAVDRTAAEIIAGSGVEEHLAIELWVGLGFQPVDLDVVAFTADDERILADLALLAQMGIAGPEVTLPMTRVLGQALSRVAAAQVQAFSQRLADAASEAHSPEEEAEVLTAITELLLPGFERFISYTWRRHLMAAVHRQLLDREVDSLVVGFVDLVDYTRETKDLGDTELSELLARYQRVVYEQVTAVDGRIVKTLGDGVMFSVDSPIDAAQAALGMVDACARDELLTGVRVGLALGHVVAVEGDLFGETVNRASRLADEAHPHTVLADDETGEALLAAGRFTVKRVRPRKLKGLGAVPAWVVRPPRI